MSTESTTFGLNASQLAQLWTLGDVGQGESNPPEQEKADLLLDRLAEKMPLEEALAQVLPKVLAQLCHDIKPFEGDSFNALLVDPNTDLAILKQIKDYAKKQVKLVATQDERDVISVIYYAAIASAQVHHNHSITSFSRDHIHAKLKLLLNHSWLTSEIRHLFEQVTTASEAPKPSQSDYP